MKSRFPLLRLLAGAAGACLSVPAHADILAECGASTGKAYYPGEGGWVDDAVSKGSYLFTVEGATPNVLFKDARGQFIDATADGGEVRLTYVDPKRGEFGLTVSYEATGVMETFSVTSRPEGRRLLWTSSKTGKGGVAKVAAYTAACN